MNNGKGPREIPIGASMLCFCGHIYAEHQSVRLHACERCICRGFTPQKGTKPMAHETATVNDSHAACLSEWAGVRSAARKYAEAMDALAEATRSHNGSTSDELEKLLVDVKRTEDWLRREVVEYGAKRRQVIDAGGGLLPPKPAGAR